MVGMFSVVRQSGIPDVMGQSRRSGHVRDLSAYPSIAVEMRWCVKRRDVPRAEVTRPSLWKARLAHALQRMVPIRRILVDLLFCVDPDREIGLFAQDLGDLGARFLIAAQISVYSATERSCATCSRAPSSRGSGVSEVVSPSAASIPSTLACR